MMVVYDSVVRFVCFVKRSCDSHYEAVDSVFPIFLTLVRYLSDLLYGYSLSVTFVII